MKKSRFTRLPGAIAVSALFALPVNVFGQNGLLFDGDFESGTFQGWTPGGENGGFATVAAKGSCFSGNDTTAISFNGNPTSNYSALLRSNAAGETGSVASLRSQPFEAGNGIIFSALSETASADPRDHPVDLVVKIINSSGDVVSEQPYRTAIVQLAAGCPSEPRDTAFSGHFIDTHHLAGEQISIEFNQNTRNQGQGYFTLIDDVIYIDSSSFLLSTSQPRAVAGTGITTSGTFFLDPRASTDPDDAPIELNYSWFINGENSIRELDVPCVNLNSDFQLGAGNHIATLYVNDGFSYAADTIRFVVPESTSTSTDSSDDDTTDDGADDDTTNTNTTTTSDAGAVTLTDPLNECDINLDVVEVDNSDDDGDINDNSDNGGSGANDGSGTDTNSAATIVVTGNPTFTIGGDPVLLVSNADITDSDVGDSVQSVTITISNAQAGDALALDSVPAGITSSPSSDGSSLTLSSDSGGGTAGEFESAIESVTFNYLVPSGDTAVTTERSVTFRVNDGTVTGAPTTLTITVNGG